MEADALVYKPQKPKLVLQAAIMLGGLLLSLWMMNNATLVMHRELRLTVFFAAFFGCVVFGYTFLYNALRVWSSEPLLKADAEGLWFHGSHMYHGKILWSDVSGYEVAQYGLSKKVIVRLKQPEAFAAKYSDFRRVIFKRMLKRYGSPVALPMGLFEGNVVNMLHEISAFGKQQLTINN